MRPERRHEDATGAARAERQAGFAHGQRQTPQILAIERQDVEGVELPANSNSNCRNIGFPLHFFDLPLRLFEIGDQAHAAFMLNQLLMHGLPRERLRWRFRPASGPSLWLDISAQTRLADDQKSKV